MPVYSPKPGTGFVGSNKPRSSLPNYDTPRLPSKGGGAARDIIFSGSGVGDSGSTSGADNLVTTNNSHYINFASASSQGAFIADGAQTGLDLTGDFTISYWANFQGSQTTGTKYIVSKHKNENGERGYAIFYNLDASPDRLTVQVYEDDSTISTTYWGIDIAVLRDGWVHYMITCDISNGLSTKFKLFINGIDQGNGTTSGGNIASINNNAQPFVLGALTSAGASALDVNLDSVKVYSSVQTVASCFEFSTSQTVESDLVGFWKFDNNYADETTNANTLTGINTPTFVTDVLFGIYGLLERIDPAMDGEVIRGIQLGFRSTVWTTQHGATVGDTTGTNTSNNDMRASIERGQAGSNTWVITRAFMSFDTSVISTPYLQSAFIWLRTESNDVDVGFELGLTNSSPASDTSLVPEDFDQCGDINSPTEGADRIDYSSTRALMWFLLNSTGLGWINRSGITHFGIRVADDYSNSVPSHTGSQRSMVDISTSETSTGYLKPWLGIIKGEL